MSWEKNILNGSGHKESTVQRKHFFIVSSVMTSTAGRSSCAPLSKKRKRENHTGRKGIMSL